MHSLIPAIGLSGHLALTLAGATSAVSPEARSVCEHAARVADSAEQSVVLFGFKQAALSQLASLSAEVETIDAIALIHAKRFLRALPEHYRLPELAADPDGSISLDWVASRTRMFSVSIDESDRLAYAWIDGVDSGHGVVVFDGQHIPRKVLEGIEALDDLPSALWAA